MRLVVSLFSVFLFSSAATARDLTFEDRVKAQQAIERVYYSHQIGVTRTFEDAVPRAILEKKVRTYLKQTVALERFWKTPVTAGMIQAELERIARQTRMPERLRELYAALGNDPFLIQECLARATLVDRLARNFYAFDPTQHVETRRRADEIHRQLVEGTLDPWSDHPDRSVFDLVEREQGAGEPKYPEREGDLRNGARPARRSLSPDEFRRERARLPGAPGRVDPVQEERDAFVIRVVLSAGPHDVRVASFVFSKRSWDLWWKAVQGELQGERVAAMASEGGSVSTARTRATGGPGDARSSANEGSNAPSATGLPCVEDDTWDGGILDDVPDPRREHTAIWTGSLMIVWGGDNPIVLNTGGRYDPATDNWTAMTTTDAPSARFSHTAVWTGSAMVVWGGGDYFGQFATGGRYDPVTDRWTATSTAGAPSARASHTAVWTGSVMVVWGGYLPDGSGPYFNTGGRYDPATDTWTATSTIDAPSARVSHTAVWTGSVMVVWGGAFTNSANSLLLDTGGRYDPATDNWTATSTLGAPEARAEHTATWAESAMVFWGGYAAPYSPWNYINTGSRYDPLTDTWLATATNGAPSPRSGHTAVWTGSVMVVWGGHGDGDLNTGGRYVLGASVDDDGDGYSECDGDCNDGNTAVHPDAPEICDDIDNDCDGATDNPARSDGDLDSVDDGCDNCPSAYNPGQENSDGVGEGDACDITVTFPLLPVDVACGGPPPTIRWSPEVYNRFKVFLSWLPAFPSEANVTSGDALLKTTTWTVLARKWARICSKADPVVYIKVLGKSTATKVKEYSEVAAIKVR